MLKWLVLIDIKRSRATTGYSSSLVYKTISVWSIRVSTKILGKIRVIEYWEFPNKGHNLNSMNILINLTKKFISRIEIRNEFF